MRLRRDILGAAAIIGALAAYWIGSEIHYSRSISPEGISTVADYFHRFGEPRGVHEIGREGKTYYMLFGRGPSALVFALPSSPPTYVFDDAGRFVEWCPDRGETRSGYNQRWPLSETGRVDVGTFKQRFGL
jgi:hypothetical protein